MYEVEGIYGKATIFSNGKDEKSINQIKELLNQEWTNNINIKIMSDFHAGAGCVIGTTIKIKDKVIPNLVGVDIGCGMKVIKLGKIDINLKELDEFIRESIPSGFNINSKSIDYKPLWDLHCLNSVNLDRAFKSIGTLGGGNHFIEIDESNNGEKYLVIHSGSRNLGVHVAKYHQNVAINNLKINNKEKIINKLKLEGREKDIQSELSKIKKNKTPKHLAYLEGIYLKNYLNDMKITQKYASINRNEMANKIVKYLNIKNYVEFETIHNYIDIDNMILRKGAISAKKGELVIIPMNMRDGCLLAKGKGNPNWNYSAPHGAGRTMSRTQAKNSVNLKDFKKTMKGIYSTSIVETTLDESPMAYKPMNEIIENIKDTVEILDIIKPIYNFKSI
jgi:RNA-splicing ligase RtcB